MSNGMAGIGKKIGGLAGQMIGTAINPGRAATGKVIGEVIGSLAERVVSWFTSTPEKIKDDALFQVLRKPLRTRVLYETERAKRED